MTYQICSSEISSWLQCLFRRNRVGERMRWKNWLSQPVWDNGDNIGWWNLVVGIRVHEIKELKWYLGDKSPWDSVINSMCDARTQGWNLDSSWGRGRDKRVGATQWEGNPRKSRFDREEMSIGWASRGFPAAPILSQEGMQGQMTLSRSSVQSTNCHNIFKIFLHYCFDVSKRKEKTCTRRQGKNKIVLNIHVKK